MVELAGLVVAPSHECHDGAVGPQCHESGLARLPALAFGIEPAFDHSLGEPLQILVQRRAERDVPGRAVRQAAGRGRHHVDEVIRAGRRFGRGLERDLLAPPCIRLLGRDGAGVGHGLQHGVGALPGAAEVAGRRQLRGRPDEACQHGAFAEREIAGVLAEIPVCRRVRAIGAGPEIGRVEVAQQDLVLGQVRFHPQGQDRFLDLATQRLVGGKIGQADQLLGQCRPALARCAAGPGIAPKCAQRSARVDAVVVVEAAILDRHDGLAEIGRQIASLELRAPERAPGGEGRSVGRFHHHGALLGIHVEAAVDRQAGEAKEDVGERDQRRHHDRERRCDEPAPAARPARSGKRRSGAKPRLAGLRRGRGRGARPGTAGGREARSEPASRRFEPQAASPTELPGDTQDQACQMPNQNPRRRRESGGRCPRGVGRSRFGFGRVRARQPGPRRRRRGHAAVFTVDVQSNSTIGPARPPHTAGASRRLRDRFM